MNGELPLGQIIQGDNCEVLRGFPSNVIDLVVTSPPYGNLREYGGHSWDFFGLAWNLTRVLAQGGVIVWNVADSTIEGSETGESLRQALHFKELGLRLHDTMVFQKENPMPKGPRHPRYEQAWEYVYIFSKGQPKTFNPIMEECIQAGELIQSGNSWEEGHASCPKRKHAPIKTQKRRTNIWSYPIGNSGKSHPAVFPEQFALDHIATWSNPGEVVLDPFAGSGTTPKAAKSRRREFIAIEINPDYIPMIETEVNNAQIDLPLVETISTEKKDSQTQLELDT